MPRARNVLVADDDPMIRDILFHMLKEEGFGVFLAEDGYQALKSTKDNNPDIMLLDLNMPRMNGYEVIRWTRADRKHRFLPIIVLTAYGQEKIRALE